MRRWLPVLVLILGCEPPHAVSTESTRAANIRGARDYERRAIEACRHRRETGELKTRVETVKCSEATVTDAYEAAGYPYMDLIQLAYAARMVCAERVDNGTWTEAEARLQWSQYIAQINSEERRRLNEEDQMRMAHAQLSMQQEAERRRQVQEMMRAMQPPPAPPPSELPKTVHCTSTAMGGTVNTDCR
jgi:hypothetical protein